MLISKFMRTVSCLAALMSMVYPVVGSAENKQLNQPADISHRAVHSVLLGLDHAGSRLVAVGERGFILLSDDEGQSWRQVQVPVSVTLTAVDFISADKGWVVGHGGVVLRTRDGGESWEKLFDGVQAAQIEFEAAQLALNPDNRRSKWRLREAKNSVASGADKPFLNVHFADEMNGTIVGAYGFAFTTNDGGLSWRSIIGQIPNSMGMHLYAAHAQGNRMFFLGEQGSLFRSAADGSDFERLDTPYEGSFFGMVESKNSDLLLYGLRGHLFRSSDSGDHWQNIQLPLPVTLTSGLLLKDGGIVLIDETGQVMLSRDQGNSFSSIPVTTPSAFSDVIETSVGDLLLSGVRGISRVSVNNLKSKVADHE